MSWTRFLAVSATLAGLAVSVMISDSAAGSPPPVEVKAPAPMSGADRVVVTIPLTERWLRDKVAAAIESDSVNRPPTLRMTLVGVEPPKEPGVVVRVFLNEPKADQATQTTGNPGYVGSIAFYGEAGKPGPQGYFLNLTPALRRLAKAGKLKRSEESVDITFVIAPAELGADVSKVRIPFEQVRLSASE